MYGSTIHTYVTTGSITFFLSTLRVSCCTFSSCSGRCSMLATCLAACHVEIMYKLTQTYTNSSNYYYKDNLKVDDVLYAVYVPLVKIDTIYDTMNTNNILMQRV